MKIFLLVCCIVMVGFSVSLGATIESITVYEQTGYVVAMTYLINHPRLGIGMENDAYFDFFGGGGWSLGPNPPPIDGEIYDSYISNSDGTQNMNGMYLTINCFRGL